MTFAPGVFTRRISLASLTDVPAEGNEDLTATLSAADPRVDVTSPEASVTITEDGIYNTEFCLSP